MGLDGSKTLENLKKAVSAEAQARTKYSIYARIAKNEGFNAAADLFERTADNERAHAELWLTLISEGIPASTAKALEDAAGGENYEWSSMYAQFAETAREEGFENIAALFGMVSDIEREHEKNYRSMLDLINSGKVFTEDGETVWICRNCGHIHYGKSAPQSCPVCNRPQQYFQRKTAS